MELLIFFVGAVIWMVIKSLAQKPPEQPQQRQATAPQPQRPQRPKRIENPSSQRLVMSGETYSPNYDYSDEVIETVELEELEEAGSVEHDDMLSGDNLVRGVIMREVLNPPRSRQPHSRARR